MGYFAAVAQLGERPAEETLGVRRYRKVRGSNPRGGIFLFLPCYVFPDLLSRGVKLISALTTQFMDL